MPLIKGTSALETARTTDGVYMELARDPTLRNIDFESTDYKGAVVNLGGRPISFELCVRLNLASQKNFNE